MEREFVDCIAETLKDFRDLVRSSAAVFYEVYRGAPDASMEKIFIENATDELLLRAVLQLERIREQSLRPPVGNPTNASALLRILHSEFWPIRRRLDAGRSPTIN